MMKKINDEFAREFYVDANNNRWSASKYTVEEAEDASKSMVNCRNCEDCHDCKDTVDSVRCENLENCRDCRDCRDCRNGENLDNCEDCDGLENCYDLCGENADSLNAKAAEVFGVDKADYYQSQEYTQMRMDGYSHEQIKDIIAERDEE